MAFEKGPNLDGSVSARYRAGNWLNNHLRLILYVVIGLTVILAGLTLYVFLLGRPPDMPVGGLDGCLLTGEDTPLMAEIRIAGFSKTTGDDGCFFFASLPSGIHDLQVFPQQGQVWTIPVQIAVGQSVSLGEQVMP